MSNTAHRTNFDDFLARALMNVETRAAYEDSQHRHRVVDALVRLRNRLDLTQTDVAKRMGIKQPAVSGFETEGSDPRLSTLQRYARAVDASLWVQVVSHGDAGRRVDFYFEQEGRVATHAEHAEVTERAAKWAGSGRRYRHLDVVPDSVPA
jgi:transcriptional regulator with XRE-family HTH domain